MFNFKKVSTKVAFAALGAAYLTAFSSLNINIFIKPYAAIVPIQLLALIYAVYSVYNQRFSSK